MVSEPLEARGKPAEHGGACLAGEQAAQEQAEVREREELKPDPGRPDGLVLILTIQGTGYVSVGSSCDMFV